MRVDERSDARAVSRRVLTLPRVTAVAAGVLLVSATISLAADKPAAPKPTKQPAAQRQVLVVPDVTHQMFVFASGMLEDGGFGWEGRGAGEGYTPDMLGTHAPNAGG